VHFFSFGLGNFSQALNNLHLSEETFLTIAMRDILLPQIRGFRMDPLALDPDSFAFTALPNHGHPPLDGLPQELA
jgi:hypothetical protein